MPTTNYIQEIYVTYFRLLTGEISSIDPQTQVARNLPKYLGFVYGNWVLFFSYHCLVGCFSMIIWTPPVLCLICMCFVFLYLHLFSATDHVSHGKAH